MLFFLFWCLLSLLSAWLVWCWMHLCLWFLVWGMWGNGTCFTVLGFASCLCYPSHSSSSYFLFIAILLFSYTPSCLHYATFTGFLIDYIQRVWHPNVSSERKQKMRLEYQENARFKNLQTKNTFLYSLEHCWRDRGFSNYRFEYFYCFSVFQGSDYWY